MFQVRILENDKINHWDEYIASHEMGSIYHTSLWQEIIKQVYGHQPIYIILEDRDGDIQAGLPIFIIENKIIGNRISTLPCAQYCNPLVSNQEDYNQLINFVLSVMKSRKIEHYELKTSESFQFKSTKFSQVITNYSTYTLNLNGPLEALKNSFHKSCIQRQLKKSTKSGLRLVVGGSADDVKHFYKLYLKMRKGYGLLPQPYKFFSCMWEILSRKNYIDVLHVEYKNQIISSIMLLKYKDVVIYEYGASRADMTHLSPSPFLLWEAIKRSQHEGYKIFDFGRTSDDNEGLNKFKLRWNTKREVLNYYYFPEIGNLGSMRHNSITKKMMNYTITHTPAPLCQLMGRLLYNSLV